MSDHSYFVRWGVAGGQIIGSRPRGGERTVGFIDNLEQWQRFESAIVAGASEVDAMWAVDQDDA